MAPPALMAFGIFTYFRNFYVREKFMAPFCLQKWTKYEYKGSISNFYLVCHPFVFGGVGMTGTDVLGLKVLELAVDVVALSHSVFEIEIKWSFSKKETTQFEIKSSS
jgi:hypothetical protein